MCCLTFKSKRDEKISSIFEIPATDFDRAVKFYETVFGLKLSVMDCGMEKMAFFPEENGKCPGTVSYASDFNSSTNGVLVSLAVEGMDETIKHIESAGGKITKPKTKIEAENRGHFSIFTDSEGNRVGLYSDK